jgi:hypothetical protein
MTSDDCIERVARIIDVNAFTRFVTHDTMIKRQQIARRKAAEILSTAIANRDELLDALHTAHRHIDELTGMLAVFDEAFRLSRSEFWPEIVRRAEILSQYGRKP